MPNSRQPLTIWTNRALPADEAAALRGRIAPHSLVFSADSAASTLVLAGSDRQLVENADVAFGQPSVEDLLAAKKLKLVLLSSAGYTRYDRADLRDACTSRGIPVCNSSTVYDEPCAQHALAMLLAMSRRLPGAMDNQRGPHAWPYVDLRAASSLIGRGTNILLVGYGAIARRLVELLSPFHPSITAIRRTVRGDENCRVDTIDHLAAHLPWADHVINILPASKETEGAFNAEVFGAMKPGATFINIGRGDTVDQAALESALKSGRLSAAYLDVTTPEPLPHAHPLWTTPNCHITPHTAGGSFDETQRQADHFVENLRRFERGEPLIDRIF